jgi:hypothetical protein
MALFGKKEKDQQPQRKPAKRGGLLSAIGVKTEVVATEKDKKGDDMKEKVVLAWQYLRKRLDDSILDYYKTGEFTKLEEFAEQPILNALKQELYTLRAANIFWEQPERRIQTQPVIVVGPIDTNSGGQPTKFVIRERFKDFSVHKLVVDDNLVPHSRANGEERVIEAVVSVRDGSKYKLHSVRQVRSAVISG